MSNILSGISKNFERPSPIFFSVTALIKFLFKLIKAIKKKKKNTEKPGYCTEKKKKN